MNPMKPLLECKKCGIVSDDYTITESGMHLRADCSKCGQYIKYLSKEDKYCTKEQEEEVFEKTKGRWFQFQNGAIKSGNILKCCFEIFVSIPKWCD